jgi:hypothetical protein
MTAFLKKHSTPILFFVLLTLLVLAWHYPSAGLKLGIVFLLFSLVTASVAALEGHKKAYRAGKIARGMFIRSAVLEITGILLAMTLAGVLGRPIARMATQQIGDGLIRVIAGILVGLLAGIGVGFIVRQTWGRLVKVSIDRKPEET